MRRYILLTTLTLLAISTVCYAVSPITLKNRVLGLNKKPHDNVISRLNSEIQQAGKPLTENTIQILYQKAPDDIREALKPFGFFVPQIASSLQHYRNRWIATYRINPGQQLRIRQISVSVSGPGQDDSVLQQMVHEFPVAQDQVLLTNKYNAAKANLLSTAQLEGYINATLTVHTITIDLQNYTADIVLHLETGQRYFFGPLSFSPNPYAPKFLYRFVPFKQGQPYSSNDLLTLQSNLTNSVYFQNVVIKSTPEKAINNQIPITVNVTPRKRYAYNIGAGYGTDTGFRGSLGFEWRRVTNTGHYIQATVQGSQIQNNFQARYVIPGHNPVTQHYSILAGAMTNRPGDGKYRTYQFGLNYVTNLFDWTNTLSLTYQHERFKVFSYSPTTLTEYIVPQASFEKVVTDNRINTNNGYRVYLNLQGGESTNFKSGFVQSELQLKLIHTLARKHRFIIRTDLGYTAIKDVNLFPLSLRFFAGGSQSVRGFSYQSLGPGRYLTVGSAEYQYKLYRKLYSAVFFDAGNAFDNTPWHLARSAGAGLVYRSPLGPIELTVARPLNNPSPSFFKSFRVQFVIGPDI